ncbi:DNA-directed RNA polymerase IV subunit 1 [Bienertia sinuspersici]
MQQILYSICCGGRAYVTGLNPLECFVHSVTSRDSSFSENANVPGTLTRKITFFMRDIMLAYDGTVRNACGNQLVQFSYAVGKEKSSPLDTDGLTGESMNGSNGVGGHPVGALAACAISEAAYSALDQPINVLEPSPLLNFKKVLESGSRKSKGSCTVSLYFSNKLKRLRYGFEYAALQVKNHLEKLLFYDIVSTVLIIYSPEHSGRMHMCPWVCHFHVSKEIVKKKRLKVFSIIDALKKKCEATASLANVQITSKNYCLSDAGNDTTVVCITATISESPRKSRTDLNSVQQVVIPSLLGAIVKGFAEVEKVDILWNDKPIESRTHKPLRGGELYLNVSLSANSKNKRPWNRLMNDCLPIMGLIDWTRSHPDDLSELFSAFGIDVAWRGFLENLNCAANDIGKTILPEHLILLADCLSVTGEFVGLSAKGIARQKAHVRFIIKAAKQGAADELQGSLDALAWGKVPCLGTGAQFELVYSGKGHEIQKPVDIYNLLASQTSSHDIDIKIKEPPNSEMLASEKLGAPRFNKLSSSKVFNLAIPKKLIQKYFSVNDIWRLGRIWKNILFKYAIDEKLSDLDKTMLLMALKFHPHREEKIGNGAVGHHADHKRKSLLRFRKGGRNC